MGWKWVGLKNLDPGTTESRVLGKTEHSYRSWKIRRQALTLSRKSLWGPATAEGRGRGTLQRDS